MRILIVEDESELAEVIKCGLAEDGHAVDLAESAEMALEWIEVAPYDVLVLDVLLPGMSGVELCRTLRTTGTQTPVLLLTALDAVEDRVAGLDAGADDYLIKPFAFAELQARLRALQRRHHEASPPVLEFDGLRMDPANRQVWRDNREIALSTKEFRILEYMMQRAGRVATRDMIAEHVWDYDFPNVTNVIDVHVRSLRLKLDDPVPGRLIQTVRGVGYRLGDNA